MTEPPVLRCSLKGECWGGPCDGLITWVPGITTAGAPGERLFRAAIADAWLTFTFSRDAVMTTFDPPFPDVTAHRYSATRDLLAAAEGEQPPALTLTYEGDAR